ncbi:MAG: tetratricopeptide repeat protein [Acidobacteriota bacterium]
MRFLAFGLLFGFVIGYIVAYGIYDDGLVQRAAPVPAAGNMGMSSASPSSAAPGGLDGEALMQQVTGEIVSLKEAIERDPKDQKALARLASLYAEVNMCDRAIDYFSRALELVPGEAHIRHEYAVCLYQLNRVDDALTEFRSALTDNPEHWETWLYIGLVSLRDKGDFGAASEAVTQLEKLNPHYEGIPMLKDAIEQARTAGTSPSS